MRVLIEKLSQNHHEETQTAPVVTDSSPILTPKSAMSSTTVSKESLTNYLAPLDFISTNIAELAYGLQKLDVPDVIRKAKRKLVASRAPKNPEMMRTDKPMPIQNTHIQLTANDSTCV